MITDLHPPRGAVRAVVTRALEEDVEPLGDITAALLGVGHHGLASFVTREEGVLAGRLCVLETFAQVDPDIVVTFLVDDGEGVEPGERIADVEGPLASILTAERTALNLLCHLSGVASYTRRFVRATHGRSRLLDTRKTTPGLRALEKAAVRAGGGFNHRGSLSDGILLKDNHLAVLDVAEAVRAARLRWPGRQVHVECDAPEQVTAALAAGADRVLLDNMDTDGVRACVELVGGRCEVEVSGGVDLRSISAYAAAGPDYVSVGAITHSAPALDIGLDIEPPAHQG